MPPSQLSVSVIIPARNEEGSIARVFREMPHICPAMQLVFVEGNSTDGTWQEIGRCAEQNKEGWPHALLLQQDGRGKADAVWKGIAHATGDIVMVLDADLTMPPGTLPEFYEALASGPARFAYGSRFIHRMEPGAMRFWNFVGNTFFSLCWSAVLRRRVTDSLCGTKVFFREDYERVHKAFPDVFASDPFGDFALMFIGAALRLRTKEVPVHYRARTYGTTNIARWRGGMRLLCVYVRCVLHLLRRRK